MTHDPTNDHAALDPQHERDLTTAIREIREAGAALSQAEAAAKAAEERAELARARGRTAARDLHALLEKCPEHTYHAADGLTYRAVQRGVPHPEGGLMAVQHFITATDGEHGTELRIPPPPLTAPPEFDFIKDHVIGNYDRGHITLDKARADLENPTPAKGESAPQHPLAQERADALASAYRATRARTRPKEASTYTSNPRRGILVGGIIEAGPALRPQPGWPQGDEPDFITDIHGGFVDGHGRAHEAPVRFGLGAGLARYNAARKIAGQWRWYALDPNRS